MSTPSDLSSNSKQTSRLHQASTSREHEPTSKRRKIRKGTHSCWECKRRKERCIFSHEDNICVSCQKRGTSCVSQEFPDELPSRSSEWATAGDLRRVEDLIRQLLEKLDGGRLDSGQADILRHAHGDDASDSPIRPIPLLETIPFKSDSGYTSPESPSDASISASRYAESVLQHRNHHGSQFNDISQVLRAALPSRSDAEIICRATIRHRMDDVFYCAYDEPTQDSHVMARELLECPPDASPTFIARYLLRFAVHLRQRFRPGYHKEIEELSVPLVTLIATCADAAAQFLTEDRQLGSEEILECMNLLGIYECSRGNTRASWILLRRSIAMAQLDGLHLHERQRHRPSNRFISARTWWIRMNYYDRLTSILLSLPMAAEDSSINLDAVVEDETPLLRLERMHCAVMGDIIKRNQAEQPMRNFEVTKELDKQLQKIAQILPASWWTLPLFPDRSSKNEFTHAMRRISLQAIHFHLILQVHLPYLLQSSPNREYELSRIACVDSAREVLTRFIMSRSLNHHDMICRICDFIAFTAATALVLAYLSRHHQCLATSAWPAHHRHGDLGMIQQVEEFMREEDPIGLYAQCTYMADILRKLRCMEAKAAEGCKITLRHEKFIGAAPPSCEDQRTGTVRLQVPYFGSIVIDSEGLPSSSQEVATRSAATDVTQTRKESAYTETAQGCLLLPAVNTPNGQDTSRCTNADSTSCGEVQMLTPGESLVCLDAMPGLFAGPDDWTLQGIDTTLFSSLFGQNGGDWVLNA